MTPEGKMKQAIRAVLNKFEGDVYVIMPVPYGYGQSTLDYIGWVRGRAFSIEAKKPGGKLTERQEGIQERMEKAGGKVFVINSYERVAELEQWLSLQVVDRPRR